MEGKAPNLKIKGQSLGVCRVEVLSWRADLCVPAACKGFTGTGLQRNCVCVGRWGCNMRVFYLSDTDEDEMLRVCISKMTFQLA